MEEEEEKTFDNRAFCGDCYLFLPNMVRVGFFAVLLYHGLVMTGVEGWNYTPNFRIIKMDYCPGRII